MINPQLQKHYIYLNGYRCLLKVWWMFFIRSCQWPRIISFADNINLNLRFFVNMRAVTCPFPLNGHPFSSLASVVAQMIKNSPLMKETWAWSLGWEDPWRRECLPTPVFSPGEPMDREAWRAIAYGVAESDMTELLTSFFTYLPTLTETENPRYSHFTTVLCLYPGHVI